jgi:hypothetical protein
MIEPHVIPSDIGDHIHYDPETGDLRWKRAQNSRSVVGNPCGSINLRGYVALKFRGTRYQAHRVAYFIMTGEQPGEIDHVDRNRANNAWRNLRSVPHAVNMLNRDAPLGKYARGVSRHNWGYRAIVSRDNQRKYIGTFATVEEASAAYREALHGGRRDDVAGTTQQSEGHGE